MSRPGRRLRCLPITANRVRHVPFGECKDLLFAQSDRCRVLANTLCLGFDLIADFQVIHAASTATPVNPFFQQVHVPLGKATKSNPQFASVRFRFEQSKDIFRQQF